MLRIDFETRSVADLPRTGVHVYAADPSTYVWCMAYAFDDEPVELWTPEDAFPARIAEHISAGGLIGAWNANFERTIWRDVQQARLGWPEVSLNQWRCTMVEAMALSLPGKLEDAADALGLATRKDMAGSRLMMQMSKPRRVSADGITWWDQPEKLERLYAYCKQDVVVERAVSAYLHRLSPFEQDLWFFDQQINDRGVFVDKEACRAASVVVREATAAADKEMRRVTGGEVSACSSVSQLIGWLRARGVSVESVAKAPLLDLLATDLPADARRALELRRDAAKTSTAKLGAMLTRRGADGRMRDNLQYHGAGTGRWSGRGAQLQNLPRPSKANEKRVVSIVDEMLATRSAAWLSVMYGSPLQAVSDAIRSLVTAGAGNVLMAADFSNIEGRGVAWLAGEEPKLKRFREFDAGKGPDIYLVTAASIYDVPIADAMPYRQVGKVAELACGYGGGAGAFAKMAEGYGLNLLDVYPTVRDTASLDAIDAAEKAFADRGHKSGMRREAWLAAELIKTAWREAHPRIVDLWRGLEDAAVAAMRHPGSATRYRGVSYAKRGMFLYCRLPSNRVIAYPFARLEEKPVPWGGTRASVVYKAINQYTRKWEDKSFYGGLASENITQAFARDIMAESMLRVEAAGYPVVLTVHDEIVAEVKAGEKCYAEFERLMAIVPEWADGLPIAVAGWEGKRYRK